MAAMCGAFLLPGSELNALHEPFHLLLVIPIFQMGRLRHREVK